MLFAQVFVAVNQWKQLRPAKEQVRHNAHRAAQGGSSARVASSSIPSTSAADENSDEDELVVAEQLTLDQVIEVRNLLKTGAIALITMCGDEHILSERCWSLCRATLQWPLLLEVTSTVATQAQL